MRESLRVRLVLWYALVLTLVVVLYGGAVVYQSWRSMIAGVDAELEEYAREVEQGAEAGRRRPLRSRAAARTRRRISSRRRRAREPYYVIWGPDGELVDQSDPGMPVGGPGTPPTGRREKSMQAAGGATVLVGRDIDRPATRGSGGWSCNVAARRHRDAGALRSSAGGSSRAGRSRRSSASAGPRARCQRAISTRASPSSSTESELEQVASTLNDGVRSVCGSPSSRSAASWPMRRTSFGRRSRFCAPKPSGRSIASAAPSSTRTH